MGILDVVIHSALGIGGVCTGIKHGKALYDGVKADIASKKQNENDKEKEETEE